MGIEIEKKFLLANNEWRGLGEGAEYRQGYLNVEKGRTVRVRTINDRGILTVKGPNTGNSRLEFEYDIPLTDATEMLDRLCHKPLIEKTRYTVEFNGFIWEIDEFSGENEGLIFAEIELAEESQQFPKPPWVGREVTGDPRFYNANLVNYPYHIWKNEDF